jgi:hypothetical protein
LIGLAFSFILQLLYLRENSPQCPLGRMLVGPKALLDVVTKEMLALTGKMNL